MPFSALWGNVEWLGHIGAALLARYACATRLGQFSKWVTDVFLGESLEAKEQGKAWTRGDRNHIKVNIF